MPEATDISILKSDSFNEYADSLSDNCQVWFDMCCPLEIIYVSTAQILSPHLNCLRSKKERCFKTGQKQHLSHVNEQINEEIRRISSLVTSKLLASNIPKDAWRLLRLLTGERASPTVNVDISLDELNASFIHDRNAPDLEPLTLPMSPAQEDFINEVNATKDFQPLKLKSSSGPDGLSNLPLKCAAKELSVVFTHLLQLSISAGVLHEPPHCKKAICRLSKNASDCMQSGAPKGSSVAGVEQYWLFYDTAKRPIKIRV